MATSNLTPRGRVAFPEVFEAVSYEGNKAKYSLTLLFKLDEMDEGQKALFNKMVAAANAASVEKFGVKLGQPINGKEGGKCPTSPFKKSETSDFYPDGHVFVKLSSYSKPGVVGANPKDGPLDPDHFYSGCWAHASYTVYAYDKSGNKGVSFGLGNVQKTGDGESFGPSKSKPEADFDVVETEAFVDHQEADEPVF